MPSEETPQTPDTSGPSFYRWLIIVLGLLVVLLGLYRMNGGGVTPNVPRPVLPAIRSIPPFTLNERSGRVVTNADLAGKIWVADFIYTTCPGPCPLVTAEMAKIQQAEIGDPHVQLVTFTVDPKTDTPEVLAAYANSFHADLNKWWFLTGPEKPLYDLIENGFLQAVQDNRGQPLEPGQGPVTHSTYFALVDASGHLRGAYQSQDPAECQQLLHDIGVLEQEAGL
jgi:cytochrome oxidase Cu insertion factor (SCO1/SenC/PrrC family)